MVAVSVAVFDADDFQRIENGCNEAISFRDEIFNHRDATTNTTGTDQTTDEETVVQLLLAGDTVVDVELLALDEDRSEVLV